VYETAREEGIIVLFHSTILYFDVDGQSVAKQRLCKQPSVIGTGVYGVRAATFVMQWFGKHVSTVDVVFRMVSVQRSYLKNKRCYDSVPSFR
jgi:hypothetical protein